VIWKELGVATHEFCKSAHHGKFNTHENETTFDNVHSKYDSLHMHDGSKKTH